MENILLVINIILAVLLVLFILFQKSEGGALGIGVSQDNFMFSRSAGNFFTKATAIIATLFIICSLALTIVSRGDLAPTSSVLIKLKKILMKHPKFLKIIINTFIFYINYSYKVIPWRDIYLSLAAWFHL